MCAIDVVLAPAEWHQVSSGSQVLHSQLLWCIHQQLLSGGSRAALEPWNRISTILA